MKLLDGQTTATDGSQPVKECTGGIHSIQVGGTFDGCAVYVEGNLGLGWEKLRDPCGKIIVISAPYIMAVSYTPTDSKLRLALVNPGASTNVDAIIL